MRLDKLDYRLIAELDRNARQSISSIARTLREGRDRVEYRLQRLTDEGLITGYSVWVDIAALGYSPYKIYLRLQNNPSKELQNYLNSQKNVFWTAQCDGNWDFAIALATKSVHDFNSFYLTLLSKFSIATLDFRAIPLVNFLFYSRAYFRKGSDSAEYPWGIPNTLTIDAADKAIIAALSRNARASATEIAEEVDLTPNIVSYRIKKLEEQRIITAYRTSFDLTQLGMLSIKCQLYLRSYDLGLRRRLLTFCKKHPHIIGYIEQISDCNIELEFEVSGYDQYHEIIDEIRQHCPKLIRNFYTLNLREVTHFRVPPFIFKS